VTANSTATVADAPLTPTSVNVTTTEGAPISGAIVATFTDANPNASPGDFKATINWGDGTPTTTGMVVAQAGGGFAVTGSHTYAEENNYAVSVNINDVGGSTVTANSTATVTDAPLTPTSVND
jgi:hypothetical protein